jgi:hypothetical protein
LTKIIREGAEPEASVLIGSPHCQQLELKDAERTNVSGTSRKHAASQQFPDMSVS